MEPTYPRQVGSTTWTAHARWAPQPTLLGFPNFCGGSSTLNTDVYIHSISSPSCKDELLPHLSLSQKLIGLS
jgi:hypothetical protein